MRGPAPHLNGRLSRPFERPPRIIPLSFSDNWVRCLADERGSGEVIPPRVDATAQNANGGRRNVRRELGSLPKLPVLSVTAHLAAMATPEAEASEAAADV
jgi:hypothetical protein